MTSQKLKKTNRSTGKTTHATLSYQAPFDFKSLLATYRAHKIAYLEHFTETSMERVFSMDGSNGRFRVSNDELRSKLIVEIDFPDETLIPKILENIGHMFDLDFDHKSIANTVRTNRRVQRLHRKFEGLRIPSGWDPFEIAITTILGQLVSVERAQSLATDLVHLTGKNSGLKRDGIPIKLFPSPLQLAKADLTLLKTTGIRKKTLNAFAQAVVDKQISFERDQDLETFLKKMRLIYGVGPWTAAYVALKALKHSDAFPATDLILARAVDLFPPGAIDRLSPHRSYVAILLWKEYAAQLTKKKPALKKL